MTLPAVRLRPKSNARAIRHGDPWVHADEPVPDRRSKALDPGGFALPGDEARLGVTVNPASKSVARVMDADSATELGRDRPAARLAHALALRQRLFDAPLCRAAHDGTDHPMLPQPAESGCLKTQFFRLDG